MAFRVDLSPTDRRQANGQTRRDLAARTRPGEGQQSTQSGCSRRCSSAENHRLMHAQAVTARSGGLALPECINSYIYFRPVNHALLGFCNYPGEAMLVGYMRVSTSEQNLAL